MDSSISVIDTVIAYLFGIMMITDAIQAVLLRAGAAILTLAGLLKLPGAGIETWAQFKAACKPDQLSMIQPIQDAAAPGRFGLREFSWYAILH